MPEADKYTQDYLSLADDIKKVKDISYFDELRRATTIARYDEAMINRDPASRHEALSKVFTQAKQDIAFFAGNDSDVKPQRENKLETTVRQGLTAIEEKLR